MVSRGVLPFQYDVDEERTGMTALAGLPAYLELAQVAGLRESVRRHLGVRAAGQGWTDAQQVMALVLLNLAGGECVDDLDVLAGDPGFAAVLERTEVTGLPRNERRKLLRRWKKEGRRAVPSPSSAFRYLDAFHDESQETRRLEAAQAGTKAFIPAPNEHLQALGRVNADLVGFMQARSPHAVATLDMDATLVETTKRSALWSYKGFKAYQPLNTYWAEQGVVLHSEFRDGNVPAGHEQLRVLREALAALPRGVEKVQLRSDTAGYQRELLEYCAEGENERFGVIEFAIGADVMPEFKAAVRAVPESEWKPLLRRENGREIGPDQEWAEVVYVPKWASHKKDNPTYRFLAVREPLRQLGLPGMETPGLLPFPTIDLGPQQTYKLFGTVTNRLDVPGDEVIRWLRERCGKSEEAHAVMKSDLAGGQLPSQDFGVNAAWWSIMLLAFNLNAAMKSLVLRESWRMKAVRFALIHLPGRVIHHARRLIIRLTAGHPGTAVLLAARERILRLAQPAPG